MPSSSRVALISLLAVTGCSSVVGGGAGGGGTSSTTTTDPGTTTTTTTASGTGGAPCSAWSFTRSSTGYDATHLVVIDPATGDILVAGYATDVVDSGMGPVETENSWDSFLVRLTADGDPIWARTFGGKGADEITSLAIDASGDIVISGDFSGSVSFGGPVLNTVSQYTMFLAKLDADGNHVWSRSLGSNAGARVAIDAMEDIVLAGGFIQTLDLGGGPLVATPQIPGPFSAPTTDAFLAKLTTTGDHVWSRRFGGAAMDSIHHVAIAPDGTIVVAGTHNDDNLDFGGGPLPFSNAMAAFLASFDAAGNHVWSKGFNGPDAFSPPDTLIPIDPWALAVAPSGDIVLAGDFVGVTDFGAGPLHTKDPLDRNLFVTRFDAAGSVLWTQQFADQSGYQDIGGGTLDAAGSFTFTGQFQGSIDFGGGPLTETVEGTDEYDIFVVQLDAAGNHVWSAAYGGAGSGRGYSVAVDAAGDVILGGTFGETLPLACGSLTSAGEYDAFVTRIRR